ncbi:type I-E CRISPR-associated protein Cas5/CasD [Brevibacterium casei]|uniref:CRISPR-associated Cas5 family protein n=1 Tax=Brevibacterium casei S18 TaxID=1229781 RepID=K9ASF3_9MICO|nr:type I-E CRISPR-associated protein Cas5/CasD [Brevibacterium casei]EKU45567.1 CRISPR-associated Cas5 family protein [Brevibacterium casei S18]
MSTLLLRLSGPMQSWGMKGRFTRRTTELQPTKSGVVGLLAAAMGRRRADPIEDLAGLRMGVRVEQPGRLLRDFQTASRVGVTAPLSYRYYLSDAVFLAAVEGPEELLKGIETALHAPKFPLYLGRRAFPPTGELSLGVLPQTMAEVLDSMPWRASKVVMRSNSSPEVALRVVRDVEPDEESTDVFEDVPITFDPNRRLFGSRPVIEYWVRRPNAELANSASKHEVGASGDRSMAHDPLGYLGGPHVSQQM